MFADIARQVDQGERLFVVDILGLPALRQRRTLGFLALATLDIGPEPARTQRQFLARMRIGAERLRFAEGIGLRIRTAFGGKLTGEIAVRIVRAADEGAVFAEFQRQVAGAADLADTRIAAVLPLRENQRRQRLVERVEHVGDAQFLGVLDLGEEILPEFAQHLLPVELTGGDLVELFFQIGGEIVFHVFGEEAFEERCYQPALGMRHQLAFVHDDIFAVAQRLQRRGIG